MLMGKKYFKNSTTKNSSHKKNRNKNRKRITRNKSSYNLGASKYNDVINSIQFYKNDKGTRLIIMPNRNETQTMSIYFYFKVGSKVHTYQGHGHVKV